MGNLSKIARMSTLSEEELNEDMLNQDEPVVGDRSPEAETDEDKANDYSIPKKQKQAELEFESGDYVELNVRLSADDMFRFLMRHAYFGLSGVFGLLISVASVVVLCTGATKDNTLGTVLLIVAALMFTVINPVSIFFRSRKQAKALDEDGAPYIYTIGDAGIKVTRLDESVPLHWENIAKVSEGKTSIYMYLEARRAFVLPKECLTGKEERLKGFIRKYVPAGRCHLKN